MRTILVLLLLSAAPAWAEQINLVPPGVSIELRAYGLGLIPFDGKFTRFHGLLRYDVAQPKACEVRLQIDAASLEMNNATVGATMRGPEFMDTERYTDLSFAGACQGDRLVGDLDLHGQTHPFTLTVAHTGNTMIATGSLRRAAWGMTARPFTAGSTIRIRVALPDPTHADPTTGEHT